MVSPVLRIFRPWVRPKLCRVLSTTTRILTSSSTSNDPITVSWDLLSPAPGVAIVMFNQPKSMNALTEEIGDRFYEVVQELKKQDSLRAVILTGTGRAFSAGGDLDFLQARTEIKPQANSEIMRRFYERFLCVRSLPVPTIAAVNGHAIGAGLCLALACDMRVGAKGARIGLNFVKLGLHPGMAGTRLLPALVGPQIAARMLLTGEVISAEQAHSWGLFLEIHPSEEVLPAALTIARHVASASPAAVRATTRTLRLHADEGLEKALQREADAQGGSYATADYKEGLAAIKDRRDPTFDDYKGHES